MADNQNIPKLLQNNDYCQRVLTSWISCQIINTIDPIAALETDEFSKYKHGIIRLCKTRMLNNPVRYPSHVTEPIITRHMICECKHDQQDKRLVIAVTLVPASRFARIFVQSIMKWSYESEEQKKKRRFSSINSGIVHHGSRIPSNFVANKWLNEGYELVFTGYGFGAALAAFLAIRLLIDKEFDYEKSKSTVIKDYENRISFIGFDCPLFAESSFESENPEFAKYNDKFHFYRNEKAIGVDFLDFLSLVGLLDLYEMKLRNKLIEDERDKSKLKENLTFFEKSSSNKEKSTNENKKSFIEKLKKEKEAKENETVKDRFPKFSQITNYQRKGLFDHKCRYFDGIIDSEEILEKIGLQRKSHDKEINDLFDQCQIPIIYKQLGHRISQYEFIDLKKERNLIELAKIFVQKIRKDEFGDELIENYKSIHLFQQNILDKFKSDVQNKNGTIVMLDDIYLIYDDSQWKRVSPEDLLKTHENLTTASQDSDEIRSRYTLLYDRDEKIVLLGVYNKNCERLFSAELVNRNREVSPSSRFQYGTHCDWFKFVMPNEFSTRLTPTIKLVLQSDFNRIELDDIEVESRECSNLRDTVQRKRRLNVYQCPVNLVNAREVIWNVHLHKDREGLELKNERDNSKVIEAIEKCFDSSLYKSETFPWEIVSNKSLNELIKSLIPADSDLTDSDSDSDLTKVNKIFEKSEVSDWSYLVNYLNVNDTNELKFVELLKKAASSSSDDSSTKAFLDWASENEREPCSVEFVTYLPDKDKYWNDPSEIEYTTKKENKNSDSDQNENNNIRRKQFVNVFKLNSSMSLDKLNQFKKSEFVFENKNGKCLKNVGVIGLKKTGKSSLVESLVETETNPLYLANESMPIVKRIADETIQTSIAGSYRMDDSIQIVDYPHFNAASKFYPAQFKSSHGMLDFLFVVVQTLTVSGETGCDDFDKMCQLIGKNVTCPIGVVMNRLDSFNIENGKNVTGDRNECINGKKEKIKSLIGEKIKEEEDFVYTCLKRIKPKDKNDTNEEEKVKKEIIDDLEALGDLKNKVLTRFKRDGVDLDLKSTIKTIIMNKTNNVTNNS